MKCKDKRCLTCPMLADGVGYAGNIPSCKLYNCIYKIVCGVCSFAYIGQTSTPLNIRINNHRSLCKKNPNSMNKKSDDLNYNIEMLHFQQHDFNKSAISVIEIVNDLKDRLQREFYHILHERTLYPYGLNERLGENSVNSYINDHCIYNMFPKEYVKKHRKRGRGKSSGKQINLTYFDNNLHANFYKLNNILNYFKSQILGKKVSLIKNMNYLVKDNVDNKKYCNLHARDLIVDLIKYKLKINKLYNKKCKFKSYLVLNFKHKILDFCHISGLLYNKEVIESFPCSETYPTISWKYNRNIGVECFNYKDFVSNMDTSKVICNCKDSKFVNSEIGHIITGDLNFVDDNVLRDTLKYGANYRLTPKLNKKLLKEDIKQCINGYISKISFKLNLPIENFSKWRIILLSKIFENIKNAYYNNTNHNNLDLKEFRKRFTIIKNNFIITPVDKANNNMAFI